jgi:dTDP-3-amino-2,3,6-trideoxy-4-keto-D-glucose/dTDP-3-amino-3,4,6-trideoxy-alpha-D-glucose/dTDP-2,6-dideoxy-D-kanosamine transaminase
MDKVRYSYLQQQFADPEEIFDGIRKLLKTGAFTLGPEVEQFEKSFAALIGTKHAVGVGSGTDALKLPLKALGVGYGDEVITAANTFIATAGAINEIGAKTVFVDCTKYYTMDVSQVEKAITPRTKAIMPVHYTGEPVDMKPLMALAEKYKLPIVEDACQSIFCEIDGKRAGTYGIASGFSLHPLKNLNVWGDAGIVVTDDDEMNRKLRLIRNHGMKNRDEIAVFGFNSRLDTLQAIVGNWLIPQTADITAQRRKNAAYYDQELGKIPGIRFCPRRPNVHQVYHLYIFEVDQKHRNPLLKYLLSKGIEAKVHYPIPLYQQEGLKHLGYKAGDFPETDRQAKEVLTLPVDQHLSREEADFCIHHVRKYFENGGM